MSRLFHFVIAFLMAMPAFAQTPKARPLTDSPFKTVLYLAQEVPLNNPAASYARIAPLTVSAGGLAADRFVTNVSAFDVGTLPVIAIPNPATQAQAASAAKEWIELNGRNFTGKVGTHLRDHRLSSAFFSYTQEFMMTTEFGVKKRAIAWNSTIDSAGRPLYGEPKIVDPEPVFIQALYQPERIVEGLPASWAQTYPYAGKLRYIVLNKRFEPLTDWKSEDTGGAFDENTAVPTEDSKVRCLMDLRYEGCSGPIDIQTLIDRYGATAAFVDYVRQLEPVYTVKEFDDPNKPTEFTAQGAISYDSRVVSCGRLKNTGFFGYVLQMTAERYLATPTSALLSFQAIQKFSGKTISPTEPFSKEIPTSSLEDKSPDRYLISPHPGDNTLWDKEDKELTTNVVYIAELRSDSTGSGELDVVSVNDDMRLTEEFQNGPVRQYYIGVKGDNYWGTGFYVRDVQFNVSDPKNTPELAMIAQGYDDWMLVSLNGHSVFAGSKGGDYLDYGRGGSSFGTDVGCSTVGGQWQCTAGGGYSGRTQPAKCDYEGGCWCPTGWVLDGGGWGSGICKERGTVPFAWCYQRMTSSGDSGDIFQGWTCGTNDCPAGMVQYKWNTSLQGGGVWGQWDGCGPQEMDTSWRHEVYLDLRPYLQEGLNNLNFRVAVYDGGEGFVKIRTEACSMSSMAPAGMSPTPPEWGGKGGVTKTMEDWVFGKTPD